MAMLQLGAIDCLMQLVGHKQLLTAPAYAYASASSCKTVSKVLGRIGRFLERRSARRPFFDADFVLIHMEAELVAEMRRGGVLAAGS